MEKQVSVMDILFFLKRKAKYIVIIPLIAAIITFILIMQFSKPTYTYTGSMIVNSSYDENDSLSPSQSLQDLNLAIDMIPTYVQIFKSESYLSYLSEESGLFYSSDQIRSMISFSEIADTKIFSVSVKSTNKDDAEKLAKCIIDTAPEYSKSIVTRGSLGIVDNVRMSSVGSPNKFLYSAIVFAALFALIGLIMFIIDHNDDKIKSESDIVESYGLPVLGLIPDFNSVPTEKRAETNEK